MISACFGQSDGTSAVDEGFHNPRWSICQMKRLMGDQKSVRDKETQYLYCDKEAMRLSRIL